MQTTTFVRKPFIVEAIEITKENIADLAEFIGDLEHKDDGTPYIQVDKAKVPNMYRVYLGFWMTKMDNNIRCYSRRVFKDQFMQMTPLVQQYVDQMKKKPTLAEPVTATPPPKDDVIVPLSDEEEPVRVEKWEVAIKDDDTT